MNDKLKKHVDILFAAAPKNQKTAEIKEELLTNLNDKYNDLLSNGYDSTAAFHIALSGIGDIDELLRECGELARTNNTVIPAQAGIQTEGVNRLRQVMCVLLIALPSMGIGALVATSLSQNSVNQPQQLAMVEKPVNGLPFKIMFSEGGGYEELSVTIYFAIRKTDERWFDKRYEECEQEIVDHIIQILRESREALRTSSTTAAVQEEVRRTVNEILAGPLVQRVFFTEMRGKHLLNDGSGEE